jgi:predicted transcriptional regulator
MEKQFLVEATAEVAASYATHKAVDVAEMGTLIRLVHEALDGLGREPEPTVEKLPVVSVRASVKPGFLICMECGSKRKLLKRHLQAAHQMTPEEYRADFGLPRSYPMVAAEYAERRRDRAKQFDPGRNQDDQTTTELTDNPEELQSEKAEAEADRDEQAAE